MDLLSAPLRLIYSILAIGSAWLISGTLYASYTYHGSSHDIFSWLGLTGIFCIIGWFLVGIPVVALGRKILTKPFWFVTLAAGLAGAGVMLAPTLLCNVSIEDGTFQSKALLDQQTWIFCEIASAIAASTMVIYRLLLALTVSASARSHKKKSSNSEAQQDA